VSDLVATISVGIHCITETSEIIAAYSALCLLETTKQYQNWCKFEWSSPDQELAKKVIVNSAVFFFNIF